MGSMTEIRPGRRINLSVYKNNPLKPTLFMIHGMGGRGYQWRSQIQYLKDTYNLIVPDLLGQGDSEKPRPEHQVNPYSFEELKKDIQALFDSYAGDKNYVFGHSYGGAFAVSLAKENKTRVQKLVLITPVSCQPFTEIPSAYLLPAPLLELMRDYLDKSFEKLAFAPTDDLLLLKEEKEGRDLNRMYVIKALLQGMKTIPFMQVSQLELPSIVISGKLDRVIPAAVVREFYTKLPRHQLYEIDNAAHMVHLEKSGEVNSLLEQFLAK